MLLLLVTSTLARPTDGGSYAFDDSDSVASVDGPAGTARVWYSVAGTNETLLDDEDGDGVPDFAALVAVTTEDVLDFFVEAGFRPIPDDGAEGGSAAMDVYLVDFGGAADGHYSVERCQDDACTGYFVMENDFAGYGYPSLDTAVRTLTSHELFHGVQGAYDYDEEAWYQEGTAVWAEELYDPGSDDFLHFCDAYLEDTGRSLDNPPAGPIPAFAYATALWWWFVTDRYGDAWMAEYLDATTESDDLLALLDARVDFATDWVDFATWNLATGPYAGLVESYPFAAELDGPTLEDRGDSVDDDQRFYPLATTYYRYDHPGGELSFALEADAPDVVFQVWSTDADERVVELVAEPASLGGAVSLGELPMGRYFFFGTNPTLAEDSTHVRVCLGPDAAACAPAAEDTGDGGDTGDAGAEPPAGCGCASGGAKPWWSAGFLAGFAVGRRRGAAARHA